MTRKKTNKVLLGIASVAIAGLGMLVVGCEFGDESSLSSSGEYSNVPVSFYDPNAFSDGCQRPDNAGNAQPIAPSEGMWGITCQDNWYRIPDPNSVQDVESGDIEDARGKGHHMIHNPRSYLERAFELCGGDCVRKEGDNYFINLPVCNQCSKNRSGGFTLTSNKSSDSQKVYFHSVCPKRHWKNLAKQAMGVDDNHCARNHIDLSLHFNGAGINRSEQGSIRVNVK